MEEAVSRWHVVQASAFPHEQEALELLRAALPDLPPFRAWSNFEFIAEDGSINEVDSLIVSTDRIYLVEIKSWRGVISGSQHTWIIRTPGGGERTEENPLLLTNRKAKKLKSLLSRQVAFKKMPVPYVQPVIFLSSPECSTELDEVSLQHVYLRPDAKRAGRPSITDVISGIATRAENRPSIGRDAERALCRAMEQLGLRRRSTSAQVGDYRLTRLIAENDRYQDWVATHVRLATDVKRVRIFTHGQKAGDAEKQDRKDIALREYRLLAGLHHANILKPTQLTETEVGPALVYEYNPDAKRLSHFMESNLLEMTIGARVELLRQVAEALQYAHQRSVHHRAISPWTIDVVKEGAAMKVLLRDWQSGSSSNETSPSTRMTLHAGANAGLIADERAVVYSAPEVLSGQGYDPVSIDIFSLGALAYSMVAGKHPATDADELISKCRSGPGLRISEAMDGAPDSLQELVQFSTEIGPAHRPATVQEFLALLEQVEDELTAPEPVFGVSPIHANKGDQLTGGFTVLQRLGSGSTCVALAVERDGQVGVLKVAKEAALNERVRAEAAVLKDLRHPNIVKSLGEFEVDGLAAIFMERAGEKTLDQRLRTEGRLSLDLLERFGDELLSVLIYLEREGINHRDIKPVNVGIGQTRNRALTLKLFDFSLSRTPADNIRAGTPPYLDPFLPLRKPARWDLYAERFAAAMTLYELATGVLPSWGDSGEDPLSTAESVRLDTELLDPAVRDGLKQFFGTALHREYRKRYDNAEEMHSAWRELFHEIDRPTTDDSEPDTTVSAIDLATVEDLSRQTKLSALGLSARELNAADRIGATTVGELLDLPGIRMYRNRGIGQRVIRQLRNLREELAARLTAQPAAVEEGDEPPEQLSIDRLAAKLTSIKVDESDLSLLRAWLGVDDCPAAKPHLELPTLREAAERSACTLAHAQAVLERAVEKWNKNSWMSIARDEVADFLQRKEGIATVEEVAARLLGVRGSAAEGPTRMCRAYAVVQAALEAEDARESARFVLYRGMSATLVIGTEQLGAAFSDTPAERAKYAEALAQAAQALAREEPLPTAKRVEEQLNAVTAPQLDQPLTAERKLRLAAATAPDVALSSRLELYPRKLSAERALRLGSNALLGPKRLTVQQLHSRIQSRFPHAEPLPGHPDLDDLLRKAEIPLIWHAAEDGLPAGYAPPSRSTGLTRHTSTLRRITTATLTEDLGPEAQTAQRFEETLQRALRDRRVLIVTCALPRVEPATQELARRLGLTPVSLDQLLISAMRTQAAQAGADWHVVLKADRAARDSADWRRLNALVQRALPPIRQSLLSDARPLLIQHLGLAVRYGHVGLIQELRDGSTSSDKPARIILVPGDEFRPPLLDGIVLPVITPADWAHMPRAWLENLHRAEPKKVSGVPA